MNEHTFLILGLEVGTFLIRFSGNMLGSKLHSSGSWACAFSALPGCLVAALVSVILVGAGTAEWGAACLALLCAVLTRNVPITMLVGIGAVWIFRSMGRAGGC